MSSRIAPFLVLLLLVMSPLSGSKRQSGKGEVVTVEEMKEWKKLVRTRNNSQADQRLSWSRASCLLLETLLITWRDRFSTT